jgi:small-conductance mechanosensitive channel
MELLKTWGIPSGALIIWLGLVFSIIPIAMKHLPVKTQKSTVALDDLLVSALEFPLNLCLMAMGLKVFIEGLSQCSKKVHFIGTSAGALKSLIRIVILGLVVLIILHRLNITITPFLASMGIGGLVIGLALQDTLSNFFAGLYIVGTRPISVGNYIKLESGEEGIEIPFPIRMLEFKVKPGSLSLPDTGPS